MVRAIFPDLRTPPPVAVRAQGVYIWDAEGRQYLDGSSGALVSNLGHGVPEISDAMNQQARRLDFVHRTLFASEPLLALADRVAAWAPGDLAYSAFVNSGSEATEIAVKLAQQYWAEQGQPRRRWVISRWSSYHGSTLGALSLSGNVPRRRTVGDALERNPGVMQPHCLFCPAEKRFPECALFCARALEREIHRTGPENVAAFIAEPIVGASGGAITPPPGYLETVADICRRHGILFIADEVMTGFGRTGRPFGHQHWNVLPDIMVVGKGLSAGYTPIAGVVVRAPVVEVLRSGSGRFGPGHTFSGNPISAAVALRVLQYMEEHDVVNRAAARGEELRAGLEELAGRHPIVLEVRGRGLMLGLEFGLRDGAGVRPFPAERNATGAVLSAARKRGLILYPCRGAIDGAAGDAVLVAPPLTIAPDEVAELLDRLDQALKDAEEVLHP